MHLTLERALADNTPAESLLAVAEWNEQDKHGRGSRRHMQQARHLRAVAAAMDMRKEP